MRMIDFADDRWDLQQEKKRFTTSADRRFNRKHEGMAETEVGMSWAAAFLAYAGAAPLVIAALLIVNQPIHGPVYANMMTAYGALLLAFFGGVRWGVAVMKPADQKGGPTFRALIGGALPLAAAMPLFMPFADTAKFAYIVAALFILLIDDLSATSRGSGAPAWYLAVRAPLTVLMATAYLVAMAALGQR